MFNCDGSVYIFTNDFKLLGDIMKKILAVIEQFIIEIVILLSGVINFIENLVKLQTDEDQIHSNNIESYIRKNMMLGENKMKIKDRLIIISSIAAYIALYYFYFHLDKVIPDKAIVIITVIAVIIYVICLFED